jgi:ParB family transcriptional regulator, chromosome partitioning protein
MCYGVSTSLIGLQENYTILSKLSTTSSFSTITPGFMGDIDISKIKQSKNIRHKVPDTEELAKSIQQKGLLQPRTLDGYFEIVAGNRRFCACKALGWKKIACHIIELDDKQAFEVSLVENIQRKTVQSIR